MSKSIHKNLHPTKSYARFEAVVHRALNLITLQAPIETLLQIAPEAKPLDLSDMTRAAIVLAVAGMDAYFTDVFAERFVPYLKKHGPTNDMIKLLECAGLNTACALELLTMKRPFRRIRKLVDTYHERLTTQNRSAIDDLFRAYGLKDFSECIQAKRARKSLLKSIDWLVRRRHRIAHEGDLNDHGRLRVVHPEKIHRRLKDVVIFVSAADEILQTQLQV